MTLPLTTSVSFINMPAFDFSAFRSHFPLINNLESEAGFIYFDNAATMQKPKVVIDEQAKYYIDENANVHRASHYLSAKATAKFEQARDTVKDFINASNSKEVIWTKGTTESINLVANSWGRQNLQPGDEILVSVAEHHANIVPWQIVAEQTGALLKPISLDEFGRIDLQVLAETLSERTAIVAIGHISNVIGKINPVEDIIKLAKSFGAKVLIDGAQAIHHIDVDVQALNCDFYVFSAHKCYGPTGLGVLYGKAALLEQMAPYQGGGEMIKKASFSGTTFNELPFKFEAGTPNISGVIAFARAIEFIKQFSLNKMNDYEAELVSFAYQKLSEIEQVNFVTTGKPDIGVISFNLAGEHPQDIASYLNSHKVMVRSGHHCAMPLMEYLAIDGCIRLSIAPYNTVKEVENFVIYLKKYLKIYDESEILVKSSGNNLGLCEKVIGQAEQNFIDVTEKLLKTKSWDEKHRQIMIFGKAKNRLLEPERITKNEIAGCESRAWLVYKQKEARFLFNADSDAKVIRGLLTIVLAIFNEKTAEEILSFDIEGYFDKVGLLNHLSPSRGNGLRAIVNRIREIAAT